MTDGSGQLPINGVITASPAWATVVNAAGRVTVAFGCTPRQRNQWTALLQPPEPWGEMPQGDGRAADSARWASQRPRGSVPSPRLGAYRRRGMTRTTMRVMMLKKKPRIANKIVLCLWTWR